MIKYINKKISFRSQRSIFLKTMLFFVPLGYVLTQIIIIFLEGWEKYEFSLFALIFHFSFFYIFLSPIAYLYLKNNKKRKKIIKEFSKRKKEKRNLQIKFLYNYKNISKGNIYTISYEQVNTNSLYIYGSEIGIIFLYEVVNRIEMVDDINVARKKKLKKLLKKNGAF